MSDGIAVNLGSRGVRSTNWSTTNGLWVTAYVSSTDVVRKRDHGHRYR
jgi:hypothetical protein